MRMKELKDYVRSIPDFPEKGIIFRDVSTVLQDPEGFKLAVDSMIDNLKGIDFDVVVGPEARGFIFGTPIAYSLNKAFVPVRKKGKLPFETIEETYDLEYGTATLEAMLYKKRMVVCYVVNRVTAAIGRKMLKIDSFSLPNLLCGKKVVKELIQEDCTPTNIYNEINRIFTTEDRELLLSFYRIHKEMMIDSDKIAADAVMKVIKDKYDELTASLN
jgi:adenine phosphoribosyltransferase